MSHLFAETPPEIPTAILDCEECAAGEDLCAKHDDPDEARDWEREAEERAERQAER